MAVIFRGFFLLAALLSGHTWAYGEESFSGSERKKIEENPANNGALHLEVKQAPLAQIFKIIEDQSGVQLHISSLSQRRVTATCAGTALEVLKCILGKEANLVYRYEDEPSDRNSKPLLREVWVLNSASSEPRSLRHNPDQAVCEATENFPNGQQPLVGEEQQAFFHLEPEEMERLMDLSQSSDPKRRKEALSRLALVAEDEDDGGVRKVLTEALQDPSPAVRAQAIFGLTRRDDPERGSVLREALHDSEVGVRLMAVSNAGEDMALLEMALYDEDRVVRDLARMKLEKRAETKTH
ncbi:HEAT repeat domain-containing protein [Nitrosococcus oceani]|uniref:HEAT repeat domain-containing protein n=1 Tax=Nitrosococcus oceani TaxID=1229 RepID=UPI00056ABB47|nr:HEAT repeat domain-containing protein [Nitrosococcus oceani]